MARLLKRWESPRREGRNDKGRGGSARQRQLKKQQQMKRKKHKQHTETENKKNSKGGNISSLPNFLSKIGRNEIRVSLPNLNRAIIRATR